MICINISPLPFGPHSYHPTQKPIYLGHHRALSGAPCGELHRRSPLGICFILASVFMSNLISQFIPPSPSPTCVYASILCICVSILALELGSSVLFP